MHTEESQLWCQL